MQIQLFHIPATENAEVLADMNRFLATHKVLEVEQNFYFQHQHANWCFCVRYLQSGSDNKSDGLIVPRNKTDYKQILSETEFAVFARLRECRKIIATNDAIPAYAVFTDEELASIARLEDLTVQKMQDIKGIGEKKAQKYGGKIIEMYQQSGQDKHDLTK